MATSSHLVYSLAAIGLTYILLCEAATLSEDPRSGLNSDIGSLYDSLLQREYADPIVFPNHKVERKAQRSHSLILRFGRRSDPSLNKRWFSDMINTKPIRSPSLRLRFGRRSDPSVPLRSNIDDMWNNIFSQQTNPDNKNNNNNNENDELQQINIEGFERMERKPQHLRWGRSSLDANENIDNEELTNMDIIDVLLNSARVRNLLNKIRQYETNIEYENNVKKLKDDDNNAIEMNSGANNDDMLINNTINDDTDFERETRKAQRLRYGRSTNNIWKMDSGNKLKNEKSQ